MEYERVGSELGPEDQKLPSADASQPLNVLLSSWVDWPEVYGQCFVYDSDTGSMFVGTIEDGYQGKICLWAGPGHYLLRPENEHQFKFKKIDWPENPA